jgi:hypothetical protein
MDTSTSKQHRQQERSRYEASQSIGNGITTKDAGENDESIEQLPEEPPSNRSPTPLNDDNPDVEPLSPSSKDVMRTTFKNHQSLTANSASVSQLKRKDQMRDKNGQVS